MTAEEKEALRGGIESEHNRIRDAREKQLVSDREALETTYREDLKTIRQNKEAALRGAGLNSDGSDPQGRPVG